MKMVKRIFAIALVLMLTIPVSAAAVPEITPQSSLYLYSYDAELVEISSSEFKVKFTVFGTGIMDELGAVSITVYRSMDGSNWSTWFTDTTSAGMRITDRASYTSSVTYEGDGEIYYQAKVGIYAKKDGGSDTLYLFTNIIQLG